MNIPDADTNLPRLQEKAFGICLGSWSKRKREQNQSCLPFYRQKKRHSRKRRFALPFFIAKKKKRLLGSSNRPGSKKLLKGGTYKKEHWTLEVFLTVLSENMLPIQQKGTGIVEQTKHLVSISWSQYRSTKPNMLSHQGIKTSKYHETPGSAKGDSRDLVKKLTWRFVSKASFHFFVASTDSVCSTIYKYTGTQNSAQC